MDVLSEILKPVVQVVMVPAKKQVDYMISSTKYVRDMHTKMRELDVARQGEEDHLNRNTLGRLEISSQVRGWLEELENTKVEVDNFPSEASNCCNLSSRHKLGRRAFKMIEQIDSLTRQHSLIQWTDDPIPLGRVDSRIASTYKPPSDHTEFPSREQTFAEALEALHKSHMIALWGMGGVGKTTIMKRLKKVVEDKKIFKYIVQADIGEKADPIAVQRAVAEYFHIELKETTKPARADKLRKWFSEHADGGKTKFLVILDDVWQSVDLEDIGLSPLPNQGVDFKVLLTSRKKDVCIEMGVEANSIFNVKVLTEAEGQSFFRQFVTTSADVDLDPAFHEIGDGIASRCQGLPIAIRTVAYTLKGKSKGVWEDALARLEQHDIDRVVKEVFKMSYDNLQDKEAESLFLLCALFGEDFNIPTEELVRYGWGLEVLNRVETIRQARNRVSTCIERLLDTNLLIQSDVVGCIKMHDLVRSFVIDMFSMVEHSSIVNHVGDLRWPENDMSGSCKRISLTCKGMSEFPSDLKYPKLCILKLMHGHMGTSFPQNFYEGMEKLQVLSLDQMRYTCLPSSLQCCTNLRVLHIHHCFRVLDFSSVGNLFNLEVLSFVNSGVELLPSTIGNLKKLMVLDLRGCCDLHIDNGVLKNLVKLEELYVSDSYKKSFRFTYDVWNELAERSKHLCALEFDFFENNAQLKNMSFENLERFKFSAGNYFEKDYSQSRHSFDNTLMLITNKEELFESRVNKLFDKTEVLCLRVDGMNDLEDVEVKSTHSPQYSSFYNLRVLIVSKCADLRFLFKRNTTKALSKLEHLEISSCDNMEVLIHTESGGEEIITFPKLKFLSLTHLANLSGLCHNVNIIELPQLVELKLSDIPDFTSIYPKNKFETSCLLKEKVFIPRLEKLDIGHMKNLLEIWPYEFRTSEEVSLRKIEVSHCDKLVNLFPCNPMPLMHHLEELKVEDCDSIEVLFNIDLDCVSEIGEGGSSSSLRNIKVEQLGKLRNVWRLKGAEGLDFLPIRGFEAVEYIEILDCRMFIDVVTPTTTNFDLGGLRVIRIGSVNRNNISEVADSIYKVAFPSCLAHSCHNLRNLSLWCCEKVEVVFEMESPRVGELVTTTHQNHQQLVLLPSLKDLYLAGMERMSHVWKCNWNKFLNTQKLHSESSFHNLTTIVMYRCNGIKYLFSPLMAELLFNLKVVEIRECGDIEEVVSHRDDEDAEKTRSISINANTTLFPRLDSLTLQSLQNLKCIGGGGGGAKDGKHEPSINNTTITTHQSKVSQVRGVSWSFCQYAKRINLWLCDALSSVIPSYALMGQLQKLEVLEIERCHSMKEVFETHEGINNYGFHSDKRTDGTPYIPRPDDVLMLKLDNLKLLRIEHCGLLGHIFTFSALESLRQLEELVVTNCKAMKVIVKEGHDGTSCDKVVVFPRLKSVILTNLRDLVAFFLGTNEFQWPLLDRVEIYDCPQMTTFVPGGSTAPRLKYIKTSLGKHSPECRFNFDKASTSNQTSLDGTSACPTTSEGMPWSFHNLIELNVTYNRYIQKIIPYGALLQLQKLEKIHVQKCRWLEEVFEALEAGRDSTGFDEPQSTAVVLPNLRQMELEELKNLECIWKSNQRTVFEFPNLTSVYISSCDRLEHVFTSCMTGSLKHLRHLHISHCDHMEVIVKDENVVVEEDQSSDDRINQIMLPHLKSIELDGLPCLKGFCLGKEDFSFPLLDTLRLIYCTAITTFTTGNSATPVLQKIETSSRSFYLGEENINSFIKRNHEEFRIVDERAYLEYDSDYESDLDKYM